MPGTHWERSFLVGLAVSMSGSESSDPWDECDWDDDSPGSESSDPWDECSSSDDNPWSECPLEPGGHSSARERQARATTRPVRASPNGSNTVLMAPSVDITPLLLKVRQCQPGHKASEMSHHAANGCNPTLVQRRLAAGATHCNCHKRCWREVKLVELRAICDGFWSLAQEERGHLIRVLYIAGSSGVQESSLEFEEAVRGKRCGRIHWKLNGKQVCFKAFCQLLGAGTVGLRRMIAGQPDMRKSSIFGERCPAPRPTPQRDAVDFFFMELYNSAAESMPEDPRGSATNLFKQLLSKVDGDDDSDDPWQDCPVEALGLDLEEARFPVDQTMALTRASRYPTSVGLPLRHVAHTSLMDLYWQFCAVWDTVQEFHPTGVQESRGPPSFDTFRRRWRHWGHLLAIRKSSQHAECNTCFDLKRRLHQQSTSWADKIQAARDLREHYHHQYLDRCIYWSLRWCSRYLSTIVVVIMDGMDKAKYAYPKISGGRVSKEVAEKIRPKCPLIAAFAHGYFIHLFMTSELQNHGADLFCELLTRVLESVSQACRLRGVQMPEHLVVVTDNTVSWAKNTFANEFFAYLVAAHKFTSVSSLHLMVGHTHEDIDQLFSVCTALLKAKRSWQSPQEVLEFLRASLAPKARNRGEELVAVQLPVVRDFGAWLSPLRVHLHGAFMNREGVEAPHSFSYKRRRDLAASEAQMLARSPGVQEWRGPLHPEDILCCVKTYMRDPHLQQPPVLVLPHGRLPLTTPEPHQAVRLKALTTRQIDHYLELAQLCGEKLDLPAAQKALVDHVKVREHPTVPQGWLGEPGHCHAAPPPSSNPFFPHLPASSFQLLANLEAPAHHVRGGRGKRRRGDEEEEAGQNSPTSPTQDQLCWRSLARPQDHET